MELNGSAPTGGRPRPSPGWHDSQETLSKIGPRPPFSPGPSTCSNPKATSPSSWRSMFSPWRFGAGEPNASADSSKIVVAPPDSAVCASEAGFGGGVESRAPRSRRADFVGIPGAGDRLVLIGTSEQKCKQQDETHPRHGASCRKTEPSPAAAGAARDERPPGPRPRGRDAPEARRFPEGDGGRLCLGGVVAGGGPADRDGMNARWRHLVIVRSRTMTRWEMVQRLSREAAGRFHCRTRTTWNSRRRADAFAAGPRISTSSR